MSYELLLICWCVSFLACAGAGASGATSAALKRPQGVAFDSRDRLLIADTGHHRVLVLTPSLELEQVIGKGPGAAPGELREPQDVAADSRGRIVVVDSANDRVQVFNARGGPVLTVGERGTAPGEFRRPTRITLDDRDNWIVTDTGNNRLQVFSPAGKFLAAMANRTGRKSVAELQEERKYARAHGKKPQTVKETWQRTDVGQFNEPGGVFFDRKLSRLYVANGWNCRIEVLDYDAQTGRMKRRGPDAGTIWGFWVTRGIVGDSRGRLIGCDTGFGSLNVFADRAAMDTNRPKRVLTVRGGVLGPMHDVTDIAVNSTGGFAVADAGNDRVVLFDSDFTLPQDPRVVRVTSESATLAWETVTAAETRIEYRRGNYPQKTPGREDVWTVDPHWGRRLSGRRIHHQVRLTGLVPGKRYYYRFHAPSVRTVPPHPWTHEYAFATEAGRGRKAFLGMPIKVLLVCNLIDASTATTEAAVPPPMTKAGIALYRRNFELTQRFYWNLSAMRYWLDFDLLLDETMYRKGTPPEGANPQLRNLPVYRRDQSLTSALNREGKAHKLYYGQIVCEAVRRWNQRTKQWVYQGSGGGTYGIEWPTPGRSQFLGGSDVAWLMCHEFHHQVESQYKASGLTREDDRVIFCHFAPKHTGWKWCTAYNHGQHWDGIAYQLRRFTPTQYLRNLYGRVLVAEDRDGDGLVDEEARLPFDERRFGSDPNRVDTDGDGLTDLQELLVSNWQPFVNAPLRKKVESPCLLPDPCHADTDGDGLTDGNDPYPLYPFAPVIAEGHAVIDGNLREWGDRPQCWTESAGLKVRLFSRHDDRQLAFAVELEGDWRDCTLTLDLNADGYFVGNDNLLLHVVPGRHGPQLQSARRHLCAEDRWPYLYREPKPGEVPEKRVRFRKEWLAFAAGRTLARQWFELAVPRKPSLGLLLNSGERIGFTFRVGIPDRGELSLFEPYRIFDCRLE